MVAVAAGLLFAGNANAQLGINVGYAPQTYTTKTTSGNSTSTSTKEMTGFFAGINYNVNLVKDLNVSVGLQGRYNTSSDTVSGSVVIASGSIQNTHTQILLDVPVLFNYGLSLSNAAKLSVFVGPTVSYALKGNDHRKVTTTVLGTSSVTESDNNWYGDNSNFKKLDVSLTAGLALTYNEFRVYGGYNMGLLNLTTTDNTTFKGSNVFVGVGYAL